MSVQISVKGDVDKIRREFKKISSEIIDKAAVRALNLVGRKANTGIIGRIADESALKKSYIRPKILWVKANKNNLSTTVRPDARFKTNLIEWVSNAEANKYLERRPKKGRLKNLGAGVRARAWHKSKVYKGAFVIRGKSSGKPVVVSRHPNKKKGDKDWANTLYGPTVWVEFSRYANEELNKAVDEYFLREMDRQVKLLNV